MSACNQLGRVSSHALVSMNRLYGLSFVTLVVSCAALALGAVLTVPLKIPGMVIGGIFGELGNSLVVIVVLTQWMGKPLSRFFIDQLDVRDTLAFAKTQGDRLLLRLRGSKA